MVYYNNTATSTTNYNRMPFDYTINSLQKYPPYFSVKQKDFDCYADCVKISLLIKDGYFANKDMLYKLIEIDLRMKKLAFHQKYEISLSEQTKVDSKNGIFYQCIDIDIQFRYLNSQFFPAYETKTIIDEIINSICSDANRKETLLGTHNLKNVTIQYRNMHSRIFTNNVFELIEFSENVRNILFKELYECKFLNDEYSNISLRECASFVTRQARFKNIQLVNQEINYIPRNFSNNNFISFLDCIEVLITPVLKFYIDKLWSKKDTNQSMEIYINKEFSINKIKKFAKELYDFRRDFCVQFEHTAKKLIVANFTTYEDLITLLIKIIVVRFAENDKKILNIYEIKNEFHKKCDRVYDNELFSREEFLPF